MFIAFTVIYSLGSLLYCVVYSLRAAVLSEHSLDIFIVLRPFTDDALSGHKLCFFGLRIVTLEPRKHINKFTALSNHFKFNKM